MRFRGKPKALSDERVVRRRLRSGCDNHPSILGKSLRHVVVWASGRTVARPRTGQRSFVGHRLCPRKRLEALASESALVWAQEDWMSCSLGVPIGRLHLGEGRCLRGRVWTSLDWRSWGQDFRVKTGRRVEVAEPRARPRSHRERIWRRKGGKERWGGGQVRESQTFRVYLEDPE